MANILTKFKMITRGFTWDKIWDIIDDNFLRANKEINDLNDTMDSVTTEFEEHKRDINDRVTTTERIAIDARTEFRTTQSELDRRVTDKLDAFESQYSSVAADVTNRYNLLNNTLTRRITETAEDFDGKIQLLKSSVNNQLVGFQSTIDAAVDNLNRQYSDARSEYARMISENRRELYAYVEGKETDLTMRMDTLDRNQTAALGRTQAQVDSNKLEADEEFTKIQARYALTNQRFTQDELRLSTLESSVSSSVSSLNSTTATHSENISEIFQRLQDVENRVELSDTGVADVVADRVMERFSNEMGELKQLLTEVSVNISSIQWKLIGEEEENSGE